MRASLRIAAVVFAAQLALGAGSALGNDQSADCLGGDNEQRIRGCSALIETPGLSEEQLSLAHGMRAFAYSLKGQYERALTDYDVAISLQPDFAVALNNRAWVYFKLGRDVEAARDVERALNLAPQSPYALDTRAHIRQSQGGAEDAFADYERAIHYGGPQMVRLYQCGLRSQGLYFGAVDGVYSSSVRQALRTCTGNTSCDPLPPDEDCRPTVS